MYSFNGHPVILKRSKRKSISLRVERDGTLNICAPQYMPEYVITNFLREKIRWIESRVARNETVHKLAENFPLTNSDIEKLKNRRVLFFLNWLQPMEEKWVSRMAKSVSVARRGDGAAAQQKET